LEEKRQVGDRPAHHHAGAQPVIPTTEYAERRSRAAATARELGYEGLIIWSRGGATYDNFGDVFYLTNHYASFPWINDKPPVWTGRGGAAVVVRADGESELIVDIPDYRADLVVVDSVHVDPNVYRGVVASAKRLGLQSGAVGLVGLEAMPAAAFRYLVLELDADFKDADDLIMSQRTRKSPAELDMLRYSSRIGMEITRAMLEQAVEGATDGDCAGAALAYGARIPSVASWDLPFASGPDSGHFVWPRLPQHDAERRYVKGDLVHPDNYGYVNGYMYDLVRTRVVGDHPADWQKEIIEGAAACIHAITDCLKPGVRVGELFDAGKDFLINNGFTDEVAFAQSFPCFGHQVGLAFDDPWIARGIADENVIVEPGAVWAIEVEVGRNGRAAGFEDLVLMDHDGAVEVLTKSLPARWGW
jgi:Xaa-Pro aminopeptidase